MRTVVLKQIATQEGVTGDIEMTYAKTVSSSSSDGSKAGASRSLTGRSSVDKRGGHSLVGSKRPQSPKEATCGRCFCSSHKTVEYHHQIVCLRCACVGHMAARCPRGAHSSPHKKRLHVRSKWVDSQEANSLPLVVVPVVSSGGNIARQAQGTQRMHRISKASISLSLSPEIAKVREDLAKVAVLSIVNGYMLMNQVSSRWRPRSSIARWHARSLL